MQTLARMAKQVIQWDTEITPHGGYRLTNARIGGALPDDTSVYTECLENEQFADELLTARRVLGLTTTGLWLGFMLASGRYAHIIAMLVD